MNLLVDPFFYHPELRGKISDPLKSFFRTFTTTDLRARLQGLELPVDWWNSEFEREKSRADALKGQTETDLWVFGYGSLMWDPAFKFAEVRRARVPGYARRFILKDIYGARGTADAPGLMAALDKGNGCDGLLFKITNEFIDQETEILWRREQLVPAYLPKFVNAEVSDQCIKALTFVADHEAEIIDTKLTREEQIHFMATGTGFLGSSLDYLTNIVDQFATLGIEDTDVLEMLSETEIYINSEKIGDSQN